MLRPEQLIASLGKGIAPIYLVAGDEPLIMQELTDAIRKAAREQGFDEREVLHVEPGFDWVQLQQAGNNLSLFATHRMIELHLAPAGPGREGSTAIREWCEAPPQDTTLILRGASMDRRARESAWAKAIDQAGELIYVWPVKMSELPDWIEQRCCSRNLSVQPSAVQLLAQQTEGNLMACAQEIDKLALLHADQTMDDPVDDAAMRQAIADHARFDPFDLVDHILAGNGSGALRSLNRLLEEGIEPLAILGPLMWSLRALCRTVYARHSGSDVSKALNDMRVFGQRQSAFKNAARRLDNQRAGQLLNAAARIDRLAKGSRIDNAGSVHDELLKLALGMAGEAVVLETRAL